MCGIAGIFEFDAKTPVKQEVITAMCDVILYRGPDDGGAASGDGFGMGNRRLAIIDISSQGHQPMMSDDGRYIIVYNGEVFNFQEIKDDLIKEGVVFHTATDTEVVLKAYLHQGVSCLHKFNGMWAFAVYDTEKKSVFISRDRLGVKPLFYSIYNNKLFIASEIKSLWAAGVPKKFNADAFGELLSFRYVAGEETIYANVKRLLPGHNAELADGNLQISQWWKLGDYALNEAARPKNDVAEWYRTTFDDSVRLRKISDVPVGVLLSGGLDSSSVAASMAMNSGTQVSSFTVRFKENYYDEGDLALLVAKKYGIDFNEIFIDPADVFKKTLEVLENNDEPVFHASDLFVKEVSAFAKSKVTVLLSGEGGDETLGGYVRYNPLKYPFLLNLGFVFRSFLNFFPVSQNRIKKLIRMLSLGSVDDFVVFNSAEVLPEELKKLGLKRDMNFEYRKTVMQESKFLYPKEPMRQAMHYDMHTYLCSLLDRNDLMTMRASIECRVPFLDYRLVQGLASMPSKDLFRSYEIKSLLRRAMGARLPEEILNARKWGFAVPWLKYYRENADFKSYISELGKHKIVAEYFHDPKKITAIADQFLSGDNSNFSFINQLTNICLWHDVNFDKIKFTAKPAIKGKAIFYVGNFLLKHGRNPNINVSLVQRLQQTSQVITASDKKSKMARLMDMAATLVRVRKNIDIVIIDVYSTDAFWYALLIARLATFFKLKYVNILHGGNLPKRLKESKGMSRFLFQNAWRNVSPSIFLKEVFTKEGFNVEYIPNFIEIDEYEFKERPKPKVNLFWLRAFHKIYNPVLALKILKMLVDRGYDARLCMAGPDKDGSEAVVIKTAENMNISDRLLITGRLSKEDWMRVAKDYDIFINTSNIDNHPVSVLEAMAIGLPVVSTNVGGLPYLVNDGVDGILNPPDDAAAFTESIIRLVEEPGLALELAKNARKKAESFTWESLEHKWMEVLQ